MSEQFQLVENTNPFLRSEDVNDILSNRPHFIERWALFIFLLILFYLYRDMVCQIS